MEMAKRLWGIGQGPTGWYVKYLHNGNPVVCYGPYSLFMRADTFRGKKAAVSPTIGFEVAWIEHRETKP